MSEPEEVIASARNAALKRVRAALRGKEPGVIVLQGRRLVEDAAAAGVALELVLAEEERAEGLSVGDARVRPVRAGLLEGVGGVESGPGVIALAAAPERLGRPELYAHAITPPRSERLTYLVVVGVQDPGNLGALARSAEAFGCDGVVIVGDGARPFGPKALRGSMGSLLRLPVFEIASANATFSTLEEDAGVRSYAAATRGGTSLWATRFDERAALWVTGETGERPAVLGGAEGITIPMAGGVESLNAAVAGALLLHERARQLGEGDPR